MCFRRTIPKRMSQEYRENSSHIGNRGKMSTPLIPCLCNPFDRFHRFVLNLYLGPLS